ncbi:DegT/DnrJ/EryC1/StrS family aminotransferase [Anaeromyxobacter oryzae]|uniref:DegT/DnrJ/EryC1/StrS aminotransferase n=1 Tax=Anaeromyxobacter oryzae TaxID=2918170 RepID=A0ABM7X3E3_9BACT|nr:DegT/DnrJ/EryC1/StrS family aminotransferase [Anaeromyxobacter oryzae]BDG06319.1 hypothetical protein AMOR_53150 [Anaeromyxobacter oryzae]
MIPRYAPTYTYADLVAAVEIARREDAGERLRARLAELHGMRHVFLVESARVGLYAALRAWGRPGRVVLPAYDCIVVPEAIRFAGHDPRFVDVDEGSLSMTPAAVREALAPDVSAVFATHALGIPCDVEGIRDAVRGRDVLLVEDAAAALGARVRGRIVGSFGDAAVISFQATKVIAGETGGALLTDRDDLAERIREVLRPARPPRAGARELATSLARKLATSPLVYPATHLAYRAIGSEAMFEVVEPHSEMPPGYLAGCSRLSSALVLRQIDRLPANLERRRSIARRYEAAVAGVPGLAPLSIPEVFEPSWIQFPVRARDKAGFYRHMQREGVDVTWTYRYSCADSYGVQGCPVSRAAAATVLGLPSYPTLSDEQVRHVADAARRYRAGIAAHGAGAPRAKAG